MVKTIDRYECKECGCIFMPKQSRTRDGKAYWEYKCPACGTWGEDGKYDRNGHTRLKLLIDE